MNNQKFQRSAMCNVLFIFFFSFCPTASDWASENSYMQCSYSKLDQKKQKEMKA